MPWLTERSDLDLSEFYCCWSDITKNARNIRSAEVLHECCSSLSLAVPSKTATRQRQDGDHEWYGSNPAQNIDDEE
jgi:hypothetical protein